MSKSTTDSTLTLDADWLLTMAGPAIRHGRVCVEGDRIVAVGAADDTPVRGRHIHLGPSLLMPGLVNAHCHLELSTYHGSLPPSDLWTWLGGLVRLRFQPDAAEREQAAVPAAVQSMIESGTTCVGDISRAEWLPSTLAGLPIRKVCYIELISGAMSPPADMDQLQERLLACPTNDPLLVPAVSPHAPYTVTQEDLRSCCELARQRGLPLAIHLAETREEVTWLRTAAGPIADWHRRVFRHPPVSPGASPSEYIMAMLCSQQADPSPPVPSASALIHMNYADDWQQLCRLPQDYRPAIVYCPRSHRFFGHQPHPFRQMLAAGLSVAIGTDSAASHRADEASPLSLLDELRWMHASSPEIPPLALLEMATRHGAKSLGLSDTIGRLLPGFQADIVAFAARGQDAVTTALEMLDSEQLPSLVLIAGQMLHSIVSE